MHFHRPLLAVSYIGMADECLDGFMTTKPAPNDPPKLQFGPGDMGLNSSLQAAYSDLDVKGATVKSAVFLALTNATDQQMLQVDVVGPSATSSTYHVSPGRAVLVCVRMVSRTSKTQEVGISRVKFQTGDGQTHAITFDPPNTASFTQSSPTSKCLTFGSTPYRSTEPRQ
jgi:hypothetical protein